MTQLEASDRAGTFVPHACRQPRRGRMMGTPGKKPRRLCLIARVERTILAIRHGVPGRSVRGLALRAG